MQWAKDPAPRFEPWPGNLHMLWAWEETKQKRRRKESETTARVPCQSLLTEAPQPCTQARLGHTVRQRC